MLMRKEYDDDDEEDGGDDHIDNHTLRDLLLDLERQVYPLQILLIMFEMCFNYVVKIIPYKFS